MKEIVRRLARRERTARASVGSPATVIRETRSSSDGPFDPRPKWSYVAVASGLRGTDERPHVLRPGRGRRDFVAVKTPKFV